MADFYPILKRAIGALPDNSLSARRAIYARARDALERQLRGLNPPISDSDLLTEQLALEDTIRRLEEESLLQQQERANLGLDTPPVSIFQPKEEAQSPPVASPDGAIKPELRGPIPESEKPEGSIGLRAPPPLSPMPDMSGLEKGKPANGAAEAGSGLPNLALPKSKKRPVAAAGSAKAAARLPADVASSRNRKFIALGLAAMVIVGGIAFFTREKASNYTARQTTAPAPPTTSVEPGKTEGRLASAETPEAPAASTPSPDVALPILGRAFMVLEVPGGAPSQHQGRVLWEFTPEPGAKTAEKVVRAQIDFPSGGIRVDFSLARNLDKTLDVSHTVLVVFETAPSIGAVSEMSAIEWRERENQAGATLQGTLVPVQENFFTLGLDHTDSVMAKNLDLFRNQKWMVFEMRFANGRRGAILVEKGTTGERVIAEALRVWK